MSPKALREFYERPAETVLADPSWPSAHEALLRALEAGAIRAAEPDGEGWTANPWVKLAILLGFRATSIEASEFGGGTFWDKTAYPARVFAKEEAIRVVPGGTSVRRGAYVAPGVVIMPPAYINVGAYVGANTMVDSHALVGSCAQIGERVHLSAAAQIGGVLEPAGAIPVVVEDEAFIGGLCGVFEGVRIRRRAVLASGVVLTAASRVFDLVNEREWKGEVPEGAVVVPGTRAATGKFARKHGLHVAAPTIVKYRDSKTDAGTALEGALR